MRSKLEPWDKGLLCQLWHRVELNLMDERPRTPSHLLRTMGRELKDMQWEHRPSLSPGQTTSAPPTFRMEDAFEASPRKVRWKGKSPGR